MISQDEYTRAFCWLEENLKETIWQIPPIDITAMAEQVVAGGILCDYDDTF